MNAIINNWIPNNEEAPALFEIFERCFPLFPSTDHKNALKLITLKVKGHEDGIFVARVHNKIVGFAFLRKSHTPSSARLVGGVLPEYRTKGFGQSLLSTILNYAKKKNIHTIITTTFESYLDSQKFLCDNHFEEVDRIVWSNRSLDVDLPKKLFDTLARVEESGVQFLNGIEFEKRRSDWDQKWWKLQMAVLKDVPSTIPFSDTPFEEWRPLIDPPFWERRNVLFAVQEGKLVGNLILGKLEEGVINIEPYRRRQKTPPNGDLNSIKGQGICLSKEQWCQYNFNPKSSTKPNIGPQLSFGFSGCGCPN
jgi:ribosomal protein S18 acetylase RimI-like enzyme